MYQILFLYPLRKLPVIDSFVPMVYGEVNIPMMYLFFTVT